VQKLVAEGALIFDQCQHQHWSWYKGEKSVWSC